MHPFEKDPAGLPGGVARHLNLRLKAGWRFDRRRRALVSQVGEPVSLRKHLPQGAKVIPMVPKLAAADPGGLTEDERLLARSLQVVLPTGANHVEQAEALRGLDGVEDVSAPPPLGLA